MNNHKHNAHSNTPSVTERRDTATPPEAVIEISNRLLLGAVFSFLLSLGFMFFDLILSKGQDFAKANPPLELIGAAFLTFLSAILLTVLSREFRALKKWSYPWVDFIATWSTLGGLPGFGKIKQKDVRQAFGVDQEEDSD